MTWLNFSKKKYGTVDDLGNRNWKSEVEYRQLAEELKAVELPYTLKFKVEPQTISNIGKVRKNLGQWFWRHFGTNYIKTDIITDGEGIWLVVWRGDKWYEPFVGFSKNVRKPRPTLQLVCDYCGVEFERVLNNPHNRHRRTFCSRKCSVIHNNKNKHATIA